MNNAAFAVVDDIVQADHFSEAIHREIWEVCASLIGMGKLCSPLTIRTFLRADIEVGTLTLQEYLAALAADAASIINAGDFARIIRDLADRRLIIEVGQELQQSGERDNLTLAAWGVDYLDGIVAAQSMSGAPALDMDAALARAVDAAATAYERGGKIRGLSYGLRELDARTLGAAPGQLIVVGGRSSMGKAQPMTARVRTTDGWKFMGELVVGDKLRSIDGTQSFVKAVHEQGELDVYKIRFSDGRETRASADHLWRVFRQQWAGPKILTTLEVKDRLNRGQSLWIDMPSTWERGGQRGYKLPMDPWLMGALLGDGSFRSGAVRFSSTSEEMLNRVRSKLPSNSILVDLGKNSYGIQAKISRHRSDGSRISEMVDIIRRLGLWAKGSLSKFIPREFLDAPAFERMEVLRGLLDTDGWVEKHGSVCLCTISPQMAEDVQELVRSLGGWCSFRIKPTKFSYKGEVRDGQNAYVIYICHPSPRLLFRLSSKVSRAPANMRRIKMPRFSSIVEDGKEVCRCISVTHKSQLYITDDYVVTHNSAMALSIARNFGLGGHRTLFFSLEMGDVDLTTRMISDEMFRPGHRMSYWQIASGRYHESKFQEITDAAARLRSMPIRIEQQPGLTVAQIGARSRQYKRRHGLAAIVVDHLGLVKASGRYAGNRVYEIGEITGSLKELAKELGIPVILLAQLNRGLEARDDKRPTMSDLRSSGDIEQDADTIMLLYRPAYYLAKKEPAAGSAEFLIWTADMEKLENVLEIGIEKQRSGPTGRVKLFVDIGANAIRDEVSEMDDNSQMSDRERADFA